MQFDLGSPFSLFYRNKLKEIQFRYPKVKLVEDSSLRLMDFSFTAGSVVIEAKEIIVRQYNDQKIDWNNEKSLKIIGTIGMDLIAGKVLVINYPEKKLFIHTAVPDSIRERIKLSDLVVAGNSLLMPAVIRGKSHLLFFDTGSSAFELITDKTNYTELAVTNALPVEKKVRSWDRILTAHTIATNDSITIAQTRLPLRRVTYMEGASSSQVEQMKKIGIGGMTGNKLFLNSILILDTKGKQFGLLQTR
ncbi:MAG TPA: hypothetical protein VGD17_03730 [Chitinophagaceae bacterium]